MGKKERKKLFPIEESIGRCDVFLPDDFFEDFFIALIRDIDSFLWWNNDKFKETVEIPDAPKDIDDREHKIERFIGVNEIDQTPNQW
jgi:hypothetical protein